MNEELSKELLTWLQGSKGFIESQAPLLARDTIRAGIISNSVSLLVGILFLIAAYWCYGTWFTAQTEDGRMGASIIWVVTVVMGIVVVTCSLTDGLEAIFAPHYYVVHTLLTKS